MDRFAMNLRAISASALRPLVICISAALAMTWGGLAAATTAPFSLSGSPPTSTAAGSNYAFTPTVSNPQKFSLFFRGWNMPAWMRVNARTGQLTGTPTASQVGSYPNVELCVSDSRTSSCMPKFTVQVVASSGSSGSAPVVNLTASPSSVANGETAALNWSATKATSCSASGGWSGSQALSGTKVIGPNTTTTTYTISCTGAGGSTQKSATVAVASTTASGASSCSSSSGALHLNAKVVRTSGISPLLVFFDATGTTDSSVTGGATPFQNVSYTWNFGDTNSSGTGTWSYGSNAGHNSKDTGTGAVAAHLYVTPGGDVSYVATVKAYDGTNTASCQLGVTAQDPSGPNGFAGTKTTCVSASGTPVPGSAGCPAGAAVVRSSSLATALSSAFGSGKRVLFKCGDSFSGAYTIAAGASTWSIGAYGACENTQSGRPVFNVPGGGSALSINSAVTSPGPVDGRIADIDFEGNGSGMVALTTTSGFTVKQLTLYNLYAHGLTSSYYISGGTQNGIVGSVMNGMGAKEGVYWNYAENNCVNLSSAYNCGGTGSFADVDYTAVLGNNFNGVGVSTSNTWETFRMSACRLCVLANNNFSNASPTGGATLKLHSGNTWNSSSTWIGQYTELVEISDNLFGGTSGSQLVEISPQNSYSDERMRNIVMERNLFAGTTAIGRDVLVSASNVTLRDNVFYVGATGVEYGAQIAARSQSPVPQYVEFYNNTCYARTSMQACAGFDGTNFRAPGTNGWAKNNLFFDNGSNRATIVNNGAANTVSNNTTNSATNPSMSDANGGFNLLSDFMPNADYTGATAVPVYYDALGVAWGSWNLGATAR